MAYVAYFFGGLFLFNAIPHFVAGVMGHRFQSPFAKPPGEGYSSSIVNVLWGAFNLLVAYGLIVQVGDFEMKNLAHFGCVFAGGLLISIFTARHFGRFNGGNTKDRSRQFN